MNRLDPPRVAILASGSGTTAEAVIRATQDGRLHAEVGLIICNRLPEKAGVYDRIKKLNQYYGLHIETAHVSGKPDVGPDGLPIRGQSLEESAAITKLISDGDYAHVALLGYMKVVRGELLETYGLPEDYTSIYQGRMTNTHPGPLPETADTYGLGASERVLELGMSESRNSFHLVSAGVDQGPILAAHPYAVEPGHDAERIFANNQIAEKTGVPYALGKFLFEQEDFFANQQSIKVL